MTKVRAAVEMKRVKSPEEKETVKATVPMHLIFEEDFDAEWLDEQIKRFEGKYLGLINALKSILQSIKSGIRKERVLLYWKFGDELLRFMDDNKNGILFLDNVTAHLRRDTSASEKMINRCKRFRLSYPDPCKIDPNRSFDSYVATFEGGYISAKRKKMGSKPCA